eukprot:3864629-Amphidinium_carterae.1
MEDLTIAMSLAGGSQQSLTIHMLAFKVTRVRCAHVLRNSVHTPSRLSDMSVFEQDLHDMMRDNNQCVCE